MAEGNKNVKNVETFGLHHSAYRCRDAEETRAFWEDRVGFPLRMCYRRVDHPTTGDALEYMHIFFDIGSHSDRESNYLAFFDVPFRQEDDEAELYKARWGMDLHLAFRVKDHAALQNWRDHLKSNDIDVVGPIGHEFCTSIYFHDPNGYRWEFTTEDKSERETFDGYQATAHAEMAEWTKWKAARSLVIG
jgi:catechol 2,3-dioxygenase-like lactoylglutathione lyase family enzyme